MEKVKYIKLSQGLFIYLYEKKVPMMQNLETGLFFAIRITKKGKFFRANGKIIQTQIAMELLNK